MANTLLNSSVILRESLRVLHQKLNFVGNINRTYDDQFAKEGAKVGSTVNIRLPNEFTVRSGATLSTQDVTETTVPLTVSTRKGVDMSFSTQELTLDIDRFSERYIQPAMARLAAEIEADALSMVNDVSNVVNNIGSAITFKKVLEARKALNLSLAPDAARKVLINSTDAVDLVDVLKGLFQDSTEISKQYREGMMGRTGGFDFFENTLLSSHTTGTAAATTGYLANSATAQTGSTIIVDTGTTTFLVGDVITFAGVYAVHPETKASTGALKTFTITANSGSSATTLSISPAIVASGAKQNVNAGVADNAAVVKLGSASSIQYPSLAFHKDAFAFATVDLMLPRGVDMAARESLDGISMRLIRAYDVSSDTLPLRLDVLYGYKTIREQLACRILSN